MQDKVWNLKVSAPKQNLLYIKVYGAVVLPSLLYTSETWALDSWHATNFDRSHLRWLRKILHICWHDHTPGTEILKKAGIESIHAMLMRSQLRWFAAGLHAALMR